MARFSGHFLNVNFENCHPVFDLCFTDHGGPPAAVLAFVGGRALLSLLGRLLQKLCNSQNHEVSVYLCDVAFQCFHQFHGGDEDTEVVHRLEQLANHADSLHACVEVPALFRCSCLTTPCSMIGQQTVGCPDVCLETMRGFLSQLQFGCSASTVATPRLL